MKAAVIFFRYTTGLFIFFLAVQTGNAQQRPHYTQYILNNYILNPALTGIENYTDVKLSYRNQWAGFPGAPQTFYASVHGAIGKQDYRTTPTSFQVPGENPRGKAYWEEYTAAEPHHGIGGSVVNYKTGYISRITATVSYAYHLGLSPKWNLSAGFAGGFTRFTIDATKAELANPIDPAVGSLTTEFRKTRPELSAGLWLYSDKFFAGVSAQQIIPQRITLVNNDQYKGSALVPHFFATAGYRFMAGEDVNIIPSVMFRYISNMPSFVDVNVKAQYQDRVWVGGNYRIKEGFAAMAGLNISNTFNVSYSYDINNANYLLQYMQRGTHEIVLGFLIGNKWGDLCPRRVW
ncbi:type IX secretion system membrane protein PorP/SprF [Lacibacter sp. MH-610]|uniref:PorP/SprF family type IX secretion system membrane protein n=1 Tax=Lacibacter sp. MH-610 TaxID=3020883 RepID=UPI0038916EA7